MKSAPNHVNEQLRIEALHRLRLLDTDGEERFDRITRLLSTMLDVPIALVSLVDVNRQWFKSCLGLPIAETTRDVSFCAHAITDAADGIFVVNDTWLDERFADNPLVTGEPGVRFYAGVVVRDCSGMPMGTLCAIDRTPRTLDARQLTALADLASLVEQELNRGVERSLLVELSKSEERKTLILDTLTEGLVFQDIDGQILNWNPAAERVLGLTGDELSGRKSIDSRWQCVRADDSPWPGETHPAMEALRTGSPVTGQVMGVDRPDGDRAWLRVNAQPVLDHDGHVVSVLTAFADITKEFQLMREQQFLWCVLRNANDIVTVVDETGTVMFSSPSAERVLGVKPGARHAGIWTAIHPDDKDFARSALRGIVATGRCDEAFVVRVRTSTGEWRHLESVGVSLLDEPAVRGVVITSRDVTERQRVATELAYEASHDELTDLPNRRELAARIGQSLQMANRHGRRMAVLFVDLDGFKGVNDTYGHAVGDAALVAAASAIKSVARPGDHAARIGGDEFVLVLGSVSDEIEAVHIGDAVRSAILAGLVPGLPPGTYGASVGVAISETDDWPSSLLQRADRALYEAKSQRATAATSHA